jgi:hypothetical protein
MSPRNGEKNDSVLVTCCVSSGSYPCSLRMKEIFSVNRLGGLCGGRGTYLRRHFGPRRVPRSDLGLA